MASELNTAFNFIAEQAINYEKIRAKSGEIAWKSGKNFEYRVRKITIPFFIDKQISGISSQDLLKLNQLLISRGLSSISIAQYFQDVKKIFNHAEIICATDTIPKFPKIKKKTCLVGAPITKKNIHPLLLNSSSLAEKYERCHG